MQRYFAKDKIDNKFILEESDIRHIKLVMRMNIGEQIIVIYDKKLYLCDISNNYEININKELNENNNVIPKVTLVIPILKESKLDYIFQKSTELGVDEIILYYSKRGIIKKSDNDFKKIERWKKILKEASEQSHRIYIPNIKIDDLSKIENKKINLVCSTIEKSNFIKNTLKTINVYDTINVVVGPEGGLDQMEEKLLIERGYIPVTFGSRILRVETAPLFVMSIINYEFME